MFKRFSFFALFSLLVGLFVGCDDDDSGVEYMYDREVMEVNVLNTCASKADSGEACFRLSFHYPYEREDFEAIYLWLGTDVVDDTSKSVSSSQCDKATSVFKYSGNDKADYDTIDLTPMVKKYLDETDSLQVVLFCKYSDGGDPGAVYRLNLLLNDNIPPSMVSVLDSSWTTGALFTWYRPTDQVNFYSPTELSGPIVGYNIVISSDSKGEDLRKLKVSVEGASEKILLHSRIRNGDSVYVDSLLKEDKNPFRMTIIDGKGFDTDADSNNLFRLTVEGLKPMSNYVFSLTSWDSSGNSSTEFKQTFNTTDSIAPLMPTRIYTVEDTLFPGMARLDSNNRLLIYWGRSVDPISKFHNIKSDTVLIIPNNCDRGSCYDTVASYVIEHYDQNAGEWGPFTSYDIGGSGRYEKLYDWKKGEMKVNSNGRFVTDTLRWISPGDTIILRIRSVDKSGYYSAALVDTIFVSPGELAEKITCPNGFMPVSKEDSVVFCMERLEHQNDSGEFVVNVLHSEALETCKALSNDEFDVSLCGERDWELVCLSGGTLSYGVIEDNELDAFEILTRTCNVSSNDSAAAMSFASRNPDCVNPMGIRDLPGQLQEWALGRSEDSLAVLKGSSYMIFNGLEKDAIAYCTNRSVPFYTRLNYTTDPVYLYREGAKVDTTYEADTSRTLYKKLTKKDFTDTLQFFDVLDSSGNKLGEDYAPYVEYKNGGEKWLKTLSNGLVYKPSRKKAVFLTGERIAYREAASFYKAKSVGFRCCAYPK